MVNKEKSLENFDVLMSMMEGGRSYVSGTELMIDECRVKRFNHRRLKNFHRSEGLFVRM